MTKTYIQKRYFFVPLVFALCFAHVFDASGNTADELRDKIANQNEQIEEIEEEIQKYEQELQAVGAEKKTLENAVYTLDVSRRKIASDISLTENRIENTDLEITKLGLEITDRETQILQNTKAIAETIRVIHQLESDSLIETVLANTTISDAWDRVERLQRVQTAMRDDIKKLAALKEDLEGKKDLSEEKKEDLTDLRTDLSGQKQVLDVNRIEKNQLLSTTKNKESEYQRILREKQEARAQMERELRDFESQLEFALDSSRIPPAGSGVLSWPFARDIMARCPSYEGALGNVHCITQYFGNTAFARSGAYNGAGHNGIDFRATVGTKILAALGGRVRATGNTDAVPGCYSYGKWVLLEHGNGLSTLYAHLSHIGVSNEETVATGQVIGYSGNTGYSTGPHLHFTVFASQGVRIVKFSDIKKITNCGPASVPVAPTDAYLNPLQYL